jgi:hypothetical protein
VSLRDTILRIAKAPLCDNGQNLLCRKIDLRYPRALLYVSAGSRTCTTPWLCLNSGRRGGESPAARSCRSSVDVRGAGNIIQPIHGQRLATDAQWPAHVRHHTGRSCARSAPCTHGHVVAWPGARPAVPSAMSPRSAATHVVLPHTTNNHRRGRGGQRRRPHSHDHEAAASHQGPPSSGPS